MAFTIRDTSANQVAVRHLMRTQYELFNTQIQVSTGQKSQNYLGISSQSQRLINTENTKTLLEKFQQNNVTTNFRLDGLNTTTDTLNGSIKNFYDSLSNFQLTGGQDPDRIKEIQTEAFKGLQDIEGYLNAQLDGRHIYAGSRAATRPVDFGLTTLTDFQTRYDGIGTNYPTTREAHLDNINVSADPANPATTNWLTFEEEGANGFSRITALSDSFSTLSVGGTFDVTGTTNNNGTYTIEAIGGGGTWIDVKTEMLTDEAAPGLATTTLTPLNTDAVANGTSFTNVTDFSTIAFDRATGSITVVPNALPASQTPFDSAVTGLTAGSTFSISGAATPAPPLTTNNGTYTVVSNDGVKIVVKQHKLTDAGIPAPEVAGTIATASYYSGDERDATVRVNQTRSVDFDLNAIDPAFEKAIRAMHQIMQGVTGTEGGLDQNTGRVDDAMYLLQSSLGKNPTGTPPFGVEDTANLEDHLRSIAFNKLVLDRAGDGLSQTINYLSTQQEGIENVDKTAAITKLMGLTQSLEAAYQSFSRVSKLSLINFLN